MKRLAFLALMMLVIGSLIGCARPASDLAVCDGSAAARDAHTAALLADGGDQSVLTGARLLALLDAACGD